MAKKESTQAEAGTDVPLVEEATKAAAPAEPETFEQRQERLAREAYQRRALESLKERSDILTRNNLPDDTTGVIIDGKQCC